jgi:hypothetical protein
VLNFAFLMMHETEAAYWKEWRLLMRHGASVPDRKGLSLFVLARIPICVPLLFGIAYVGRLYGLIVASILAGFLIVHFFLHRSARNRFDGFNWPISDFTQAGMLSLSLVQLPLALYLILA